MGREALFKSLEGGNRGKGRSWMILYRSGEGLFRGGPCLGVDRKRAVWFPFGGGGRPSLHTELKRKNYYERRSEEELHAREREGASPVAQTRFSARSQKGVNLCEGKGETCSTEGEVNDGQSEKVSWRKKVYDSRFSLKGKEKKGGPREILSRAFETKEGIRICKGSLTLGGERDETISDIRRGKRKKKGGGVLG